MTITNEQTTTTSGRVNDLGERETTTVVNILGLSLVNILQDIRNSQGRYLYKKRTGLLIF